MTAQPALRNSLLDIHPLTGGLGAEILNIDLSAPQPDRVYDAIFDAFSDYGVVFFREQTLTLDQQMAFAHRFGPTASHPLLKHMEGVADLAELRKEPEDKDAAGNRWHTDQSASERPTRGTLLLAREVPASGGDTCWINMAKAYDALSDGLKATLEGLRAHHSESVVLAQFASGGSDLARYGNTKGYAPEAVHPVVIRLPENGRRVLYVNPGKTTHFEGWTREESRPLLDTLYQHAQRPEFMCRFRWREGSMAMWDNFQTWHYAVNDYHGQRRVMHRTTITMDHFK